jgi:hypothetical protein
MDKREELLNRVREAAEGISLLVAQGNVPIEKYIDKPSLQALCDSFQLEPDQWQVDDLEKILIIRDGLYSLRNELRDKGDDGEHSVERLMSATDRLYADLERAMRALNATEVAKAQNEIAALQRTAQIETRLVPGQVGTLRDEASELLTRTHVTYNRFEVHLVKIERLDINIDVLRNAKLVVQRMSASVFAIKLSLEQNVIYEGIVKFLAEGADKIVDELRKLAEQFQRSYKQASDFISDLSNLVEKGSRFTKHIAEFLQKLFGDEPLERKQLKLKTHASAGGDTLLCATRLSDTRAMLAGKDGFVDVLDVISGKVIDRHAVSAATINCLARGDNVIIAGCETGLETINPTTLVSLDRDAIYTENITAVAAPKWGVVSGTRDGLLRKWAIDDSSIRQFGSGNLRAGKSIQRMLVHDNTVLVAAGETLLFVDESFRVSRKMGIGFHINDMCFLSHATLVLCGHGAISHVNLTKGTYSRLMFAPEDKKYICVAGINEDTFCAGTDDGTLTALELSSNSEIGSAKLPFQIRGLMKVSSSLVAYGGGWEGKSKSTIAVLTWEEIIHKAKELSPKA